MQNPHAVAEVYSLLSQTIQDSYDLIPETRTALSIRVSRSKRRQAWDQIDIDSGGRYGAYYLDFSARFPMLSRMELMVAVLVKGMWSNCEIAECLNICEQTVQNHRSNIRRKLGLGVEQNLLKHLLTER